MSGTFSTVHDTNLNSGPMHSISGQGALTWEPHSQTGFRVAPWAAPVWGTPKTLISSPAFPIKPTANPGMGFAHFITGVHPPLQGRTRFALLTSGACPHCLGSVIYGQTQ